jgi:hypothetical protein
MRHIEQEDVTVYCTLTYWEISYAHLTTEYVMQNEICRPHVANEIDKVRKHYNYDVLRYDVV